MIGFVYENRGLNYAIDLFSCIGNAYEFNCYFQFVNLDRFFFLFLVAFRQKAVEEIFKAKP